MTVFFSVIGSPPMPWMAGAAASDAVTATMMGPVMVFGAVYRAA